MATKYAPRTQTAAVARAASYVGKSYPAGWCQEWTVVKVFGTGGVGDFDGDSVADAEDGWAKAVKYGKVVKASQIKNVNDIPAGYMAYWKGGSRHLRNGRYVTFGHAATTAGKGYIYSTDLPTSGKVGKVRIETPARTWGKVFLGYVLVDGNGYTLTDKPKTPAKKPADWFGIDLRNLAGFDVVHGAKTIAARLPAIVADIKKVNREVVCVLELPNSHVVNFTNRMAAIGYQHATGDLGRHIYVKVKIKTGVSQMFDLKPRLRGDTKQGFGLVLYPNTSYATAVCTAQLENEDLTGKTQVGQATNLIDKFEAFCDSHDVADSRRFYALDTNSDNKVRDYFESVGYVDAFDVAYSSENNKWRSIIKWFGKPTVGKRIDLIAVPKGRPVRRARLRGSSSLTDHLDSFVDVGKAT